MQNLFSLPFNLGVPFLFIDYFMKEMGPFSEIFANLESMNRAVSNALVESAKVSDFNHLVISRWNLNGISLNKEIKKQLISLFKF